MAKAARNPQVSRNSVVGICDPGGTLHGQGLLIGVDDEPAAVLTCHHVIAGLRPANLRVVVRGPSGAPGSPIPAELDSDRSSSERDAVVLRLGIERPPANPVLQQLNPDYYGGELPKRAVGLSLKQTGSFTGFVGAAINSVRLPVEKKGAYANPPSGFYQFAQAFPLHNATDTREGISGSPVYYEDAVIGLIHFSRKAAPDHEREAYIVPIKAWAEKWVGLDRLIEPFIDGRLRAAATVKTVRDLRVGIGTDITVAAFRPDIYIERPAAASARAAFQDNKAVVIIGRPLSGKTRQAWELLKQRPDWLVVIPNTAEPPPEFEFSSFVGKEVILFFDDLHEGALTYDPLVWRRRFSEGADAVCSLICTARDGQDWRTVQSSPRLAALLKVIGPDACVFLSKVEEHGADLQEADGLRLAISLGLTRADFYQRFDGTPGSLTVDLNEMRKRYDRLSNEPPVDGVSMTRLLDAAKLLYEGSQRRLTEPALRAVAEQIRDNRPLSEELWQRLQRRTREEGFGQISPGDGQFRTYRPYLEKCVGYEPSTEHVAKLVGVLKGVQDYDGLTYLAQTLFMRYQAYEPAEEASRAAIAGGNKSGEEWLAEIIAHQPGREAEAEQYYRDNIRAGRDAWLNFGNFLKDHGRAAEAQEAYREAIRSGRPDELAAAHYNLAELLLAQPGRQAEAEEELRLAAQSGFFFAQARLAELLALFAGREHDAESAAREVIRDIGERLAQEQPDGQEFAKEPARPPSEIYKWCLGTAWVALGRVLRAAPERRAEAEQAFRTAAQFGMATASWHLGALLRDQPGREQEAEKAFRDAIAGGEVRAHHDLGYLLAAQPGREQEAEQAYGAAIEAGVKGVQNHLGILLDKQSGRRAEAATAYEAAIEEGDPRAAFNLGLLLTRDPPDLSAAEQAFRTALDGGIAEAHLQLALVLSQRPGREHDEEEHLRAAACTGDPTAEFLLAAMLILKSNKTEEGMERLTRAAAAGVKSAVELLQQITSR